MKISSLLQGKKRYAAAAVTAATLGGGAFAFANTLTVSSNTLGAGSAPSVASPDPACNPTFSYTTSWDSSNSRFDVDTVTATAASDTANCNSDTIQGELTMSSGSPVNLAVTSYSGGTASAPATASWNVSSSNIDASLVTGVSGAVTGTK